MRCPDHPRELVNNRCPLCQGELKSTPELGEAAAMLTFDPAPSAQAKKRNCPSCGAPMRHLRIGKTQAWVDHCETDDLNWVEKSDARTLDMVLKSQARQHAFATMSETERKELAGGLAEATHQDTGPDVGVIGGALVAAGVPLVDRVEGDKTPWLTWSYALALCVVYLTTTVTDLAYRAGSGDLFTAFTSGFAHFDVGHLAGNVLFLFVFGSAAEQKLPRWAYASVVVFLAPITTLVEATAAAPGTAIGGASGAIAGLIGLCLFLQPKARVILSMPRWKLSRLGGAATQRPAIRVPLWLYGVGWAALQGLFFSMGFPGVAFLAHISGFGLGLALGFMFSRRRPA